MCLVWSKHFAGNELHKQTELKRYELRQKDVERETKFLEGHLTQEKENVPKRKDTHNRLGLLVKTFQKPEERNDIGRQFLNISSPSLTQPLRLLILSGKRFCSDAKQRQCQ